MEVKGSRFTANEINVIHAAARQTDDIEAAKDTAILIENQHLGFGRPFEPTIDDWKYELEAQARERAVELGIELDNKLSEQDCIFTIYQLKDSEENHYRRWESYENLQKQGEQPDISNYDRVYTGKMEQSATLENIYQEFNINKPADFTGNSLSISDIVVVESIYNEPTANYVDDIGFTNCPVFARQHEQLEYMKAGYYGHIDFLGSGGIVGETIYYKDKESFDKEVYESSEIGRPIDCHVYEHQKATNEHLDSIRFDNDIDLDKEKTRKKLGFKDTKYPDDLDDFTFELMTAIVGEENMIFERPQSIAERIKAAKEASKECSTARSLDNSNRKISKERETR